ncbi:AAA family ATPase [Nonomuraea sp. CA-143628]|uniref:AAA family ATPase n=1 Tax=Nonomuraea sp. CA-143628 TaxID=3239997 RepID=UPI003D8E8D12
MLYGRGAEQAEIDALLEAARAGRSGAVVVKGETGIGKSALLGYAAGRAAGWPVLRTLGVESETELPFAALHLLLRPVLGHAERLPPGQAAALRGAIGAAPAEVADRFLVGLAALTLLSDLAGDGPILCLVDDAQWLDDASADALLFAARRLDAEGVVMLFALRDGAATPRPGALAAHGVAELRLGRLEAAVAAEFLADQARDLVPQVRRRVLDEAAGNPLALIEFAAVLTPEQRAGRLSPLPFAGESGPLSDRVRTTFEAYIDRFPEPARAALLVAAADDTGDLDLILRAAARLGATVADLALAEREELIELSAAGLSFRHPLIRSAAYRGAPYFRRVAAHLALAESLSDQTGRCLGDPMGRSLDGRTTMPLHDRTAGSLHDQTTTPLNNWTAASLDDHAAESLDSQARADRRAWHRAAAATGPDERVAGELERAALRARDRQGTAAASVAYERAADLTADTARTARRLIAAAELAVQAGQLKRAAGLADRAAPLATTPAELACLAQVRACVEVEQRSPSAAGRILAEGAEHVRTADPALAARMLAEAIHYASFAADPKLAHDADHRLSALASPLPKASQPPQPEEPPPPLPKGQQPPLPDGPQPPQQQAPRSPRPEGPQPPDGPRPLPQRPEVLAAGMAVMARLVEGQAVADLSPIRAAARLARDSPDLLPLAASLSIVSGDEVAAHGLAESLVARCRERGLIGLLPQALALFAQAQMLRGRHREASAAASEALTVASDIHQAHRAGHLHGLLAWLAAVGVRRSAAWSWPRRRTATSRPPGRSPPGRSVCPSWARAGPGPLSTTSGRRASAIPWSRSARRPTWWRRRSAPGGRIWRRGRRPGSRAGRPSWSARGRTRSPPGSGGCWPRATRRAGTSRGLWPYPLISRSSRRATSCCTASGSGARTDVRTRGGGCAPPSRRSTRSAPRRGPAAPTASWRRPARPPCPGAAACSTG